MKIVIAGAGAVGFHLARELAHEGHVISVIDVDTEKLEYLRDRLDVQTVQGSATSRLSLESAGTREAELFVAVSNQDEVNMLACAAAHGMGVKRTLARVRNPDFGSADPLVDPVRLGITRFINPDHIAVDSIVALVDAPGSIDVGDFAGGEILLRSFHVTEDSVLTGRPLSRLKEDYAGVPFLVASIQREGRHIVPHGDDRMEPGDRVYMLMTRESLPVFRRVVAGSDRVQRVVIYGAERLGIAVAKRLEDRTNVVLIDEDRDRCQAAAAELDDTTVLFGSPNDSDIQGQSRMASADFFISAGNNEEHNLVLALLAKKRGARRNIVVTADPDIAQLLDSLDIDAVINPRLTMVGRLLRYARGGRVQTVQKIGENSAEVMELVVRQGARGAGESLKDLKLPDGALVGAILRDAEAFIPHGRTVIEEGDVVVCFVLPGMRDRIERMFARRGGLTFGGETAAGESGERSAERPVERPAEKTKKS
ncbi:MAG: Trk system potassium transporter TrkA [Planctomycetes bacterium]|nr:Trk system potassium transporter TrkA [Planctomycetota bacterium]